MFGKGELGISSFPPVFQLCTRRQLTIFNLHAKDHQLVSFGLVRADAGIIFWILDSGGVTPKKTSNVQ